MKITSVAITDFKCIRELVMEDLPSLVVIAGPNGSGKTALFDALRIFKEAFGGYSSRSRGSNWVSGLVQQVGPVVTVGSNHATIAARVAVTEAEASAIDLPDGHCRVLSGVVTVSASTDPRQPERANPSGDDMVYLQRLFGERYHVGGNIGVMDHIGADRRFQRNVVTNLTLSPEHEENELQRLVLNSDDKFTGLSQQLVLMHIVDMQDTIDNINTPYRYIQGVRTIFAHFLPDKEFLGVHIPRGFSGPAKIQVRSGGVTHDIDHLSSGQREILMTYTHLEKLRPTSSIILFDEPELHLHPALQRRVVSHLLNLIERGGNQIWTITHAEEIVGTTEYANLYAMTGSGSPAVIRVWDRLGRIELLKDLGASIGLQLVSPRILFVEGRSDAEIIPLLAGPLPASVALVPTGGKGMLMRLAPAAMSLLEDAVRGGQFYMVRDRDADGDSGALAGLMEKYPGRFFVWDRYHIENYLLDEVAIHRLLADDPDLPSLDSADAVLFSLRRHADDLMTHVLAKYLEEKLNGSLSTRIRLNPAEGLQASLRKAVDRRRSDLEAALSSHSIEVLYAETQADFVRRWPDEWKTLCIGRDVLQAFHREAVGRLCSYEYFRNRLARKIAELGRVPAAIDEVIAMIGAESGSDASSEVAEAGVSGGETA